MIRLGLIGLRGYAGAEIVRLISLRSDIALTYAASRQGAGEAARLLAPQAPEGLIVALPDPQDLIDQELDAVILALPNGLAAPYVSALATRPDWCVVDLSYDYRAHADWVYSLPEITGEEQLKGARRIANPGCYATAAQLALWPLRHLLTGPAVVNGVSGYSGAGTTPSPKNDQARLKDSLMPYGLVGHGHEAEIARGIGANVWFTPHVAGFFRGLTVTIHAPITPGHDLHALYQDAYGQHTGIRLVTEPVEIRDVAGQLGAAVSIPITSKEGTRAVVTAGLDNLLKGAAEQALQNVSLALQG